MLGVHLDTKKRGDFLQVRMSFENYLRESDSFERYHTKTTWPTPEQIKMFKKNPDRWLMFACYLYEYGECPKEDEEVTSKKNLKKFIDEYLVIDSE